MRNVRLLWAMLLLVFVAILSGCILVDLWGDDEEDTFTVKGDPKSGGTYSYYFNNNDCRYKVTVEYKYTNGSGMTVNAKDSISDGGGHLNSLPTDSQLRVTYSPSNKVEVSTRTGEVVFKNKYFK